MPAKRSEIIERICRMPIDHRSSRTASMLGLFRSRGYSEPIAESEVGEYLKAHPELIDAWLLESADTRYSPAWYFRSCNSNSNKWEVALYPGTEVHRFGDQHSACA